jgi:methyltransferase (TIGR00027 family)
MAKQSVGRTALGAVVCRLIEQYQPETTRLFNDPLARALVGAPIRIMLQVSAMRKFTVQQTDAVGNGIFGAQICRTRFIDDTLQAALAQGIAQVVVLGAGYDTRPYRIPSIERARVFEVDLPAVQNDKKVKIQQALGQVPQNVTFIPIDFDQQPLEAAFAGTAFDFSKPAIFIWEGVTQYITGQAVQQTLAFVGKTAPGSSIVFTYVLKSVIERRSTIPGADHMLDVVAKQSPWIFGLEPIGMGAFLQPFHLTLLADVGNTDYQAKYLKPLGRTLVVSEVERIVHASVA